MRRHRALIPPLDKKDLPTLGKGSSAGNSATAKPSRRESALDAFIIGEADKAISQWLDDLPLRTLRWMWDNLPDDGSALQYKGTRVDCDAIHAALNRRGDGAYCAI